MRAPQYRRVTPKAKPETPVGPNPALKKGLRVEPWANVFALVDGLGVISPYLTEAEAKAALEAELERRKLVAASHVVEEKDAVDPENNQRGTGTE